MVSAHVENIVFASKNQGEQQEEKKLKRKDNEKWNDFTRSFKKTWSTDGTPY